MINGQQIQQLLHTLSKHKQHVHNGFHSGLISKEARERELAEIARHEQTLRAELKFLTPASIAG